MIKIGRRLRIRRRLRRRRGRTERRDAKILFDFKSVLRELRNWGFFGH